MKRISTQEEKSPTENRISHMIMHLQHPPPASSVPSFSSGCGCWGIIPTNGATTCTSGGGGGNDFGFGSLCDASGSIGRPPNSSMRL